MVSREEFRAANAAGKEILKGFPTALRAHYEPRINQIIVTLNTGLQFLLDPKSTQGLQRATKPQLRVIEITGPGLGLHFPKLDVDLYVPGLLEGHLGSKKWAASQLGKKGGSAKSDSKTMAARENGKLGGRPRKASVKARRAAGSKG